MSLHEEIYKLKDAVDNIKYDMRYLADGFNRTGNKEVANHLYKWAQQLENCTLAVCNAHSDAVYNQANDAAQATKNIVNAFAIGAGKDEVFLTKEI